MRSSRTAYRISAIAGLLIFSLTVLSSTLKPVPVCGNLAANYAPIIAFEMARSVADLQAIFGDTANDCRAAISAQMDMINWIDVLLYIPIYGSFLIFFFLGMRATGNPLVFVAIRITAAACVADYAENVCLFKLTDNLDVTSHWLSLQPWVTEIKWVGLGFVGVMGGYLLATRGGAWRLAFIPCSLGLVVALMTIPMPALAGPYLSIAFALGWIVLLASGVRESFRIPMPSRAG